MTSFELEAAWPDLACTVKYVCMIPRGIVDRFFYNGGPIGGVGPRWSIYLLARTRLRA